MTPESIEAERKGRGVRKNVDIVNMSHVEPGASLYSSSNIRYNGRNETLGNTIVVVGVMQPTRA